MRKVATALIAGLLVVGGAVGPQPATAVGSVEGLSIDGALDDPLSEGLQAVYLPPEATLTQVGTSSDHTTVALQSSEGWDLTFEAPTGQALQPGTYSSAASATPVYARLVVERTGRDCEPWGSGFTVHELTWGDDGAVASFAADFHHACYPHQPLFGSVRLAATTPIRALATTTLELALPETDADEPGAAASFTVTNIGPTAVTLGDAGIRPVNDDAEITGDDCEGELQPEATCTVSVRLTGASIGLGVSSMVDVPDGTPRGARSVRVVGDVWTDTTTTIGFRDEARYWPNHSVITARVSPAPLGGTVTFRYQGDGDEPVEVTHPVTPDGSTGIQLVVPRGDHTWTATFNGDDAWRSSASGQVVHHTGLVTGTQLRAEVSPVTAGHDVVLHAEAAPGAVVPLPAGTLTILDEDAQVVATGPVGGDATELVTTVEDLPLGQHDFTAVYATTEDGSPSSGKLRVFVRTHGIEEQWTSAIDMASGELQIVAVATAPDAVYLAGHTGGVAEGESSSGWSDLVVARLAPETGDVAWVTQFGTNLHDDARDLVATSAGVFVSGGSVGAFEPGAAEVSRPFVARLNHDGSVAWVHQSPRSGDAWNLGLAPDGGVYAGSTGDSLVTPGSSIGQVRRYGADGALRWEREIAADRDGDWPGSVGLRDLASDPGGLTVGGWALGSTVGGEDDAEHGWVRRLAPSGTTLWTREVNASRGGASTTSITANEVGIFASGTGQGPIPGLPDLNTVDQAWLRQYGWDGSVVSTTAAARDDSVAACDAVVASSRTESLPWGSPGGALAQLGPGGATGWTFERPGTQTVLTQFNDVALRPGHAYVVEEHGWYSDTTTRILALEGIPAAPGCDSTPPVASAPRMAFPVGATLGGGVPVEVRWSAGDAGSGVARYELRQRIDGGPSTVVDDGVTSRSRQVVLVPGNDYRFGVRAVDRAGNTDLAWGPAAGLRRIDDRSATIRYSSSWRSVHADGALHGTLRRASTRGATARITVDARAIAWVAPRGPSRGAAEVRIDGRLVDTVSLRSATSRPRRIVWSHAWSSPGRHTIEIRVRGTNGHPRVDIDAILVLD